MITRPLEVKNINKSDVSIPSKIKNKIILKRHYSEGPLHFFNESRKYKTKDYIKAAIVI